MTGDPYAPSRLEPALWELRRHVRFALGDDAERALARTLAHVDAWADAPSPAVPALLRVLEAPAREAAAEGRRPDARAVADAAWRELAGGPAEAAPPWFVAVADAGVEAITHLARRCGAWPAAPSSNGHRRLVRRRRASPPADASPPRGGWLPFVELVSGAVQEAEREQRWSAQERRAYARSLALTALRDLGLRSGSGPGFAAVDALVCCCVDGVHALLGGWGALSGSAPPPQEPPRPHG